MNPTVLIFLKAPVAGRVKTRLAADLGDAEAVRIYCWLTERQLAAVPAGWPVEVHFTPAGAEPLMRSWLGQKAGRTYHPQVEGELGTRLAAATAAALARGAEAVCLVGGDCAELDAPRLRAAATALDAHDAVLGPAADGGFYLLAMKALPAGLFDGIAWSTAVVAEQTRARLRAAGCRWHELPVLRDVDTAEDWRRVVGIV